MTLSLSWIVGFSLAIGGILVAGFVVRAAGKAVGIPAAITLVALGIALGPSVLDLLPRSYLDCRIWLAKGAFVALLLPAASGLSLELLRSILLPIVVFGLVPVLAEWATATALARALVFDDWMLAALAGSLVAAVSPAVVLPVMLRQKDAGRGGPPALLMDRIIGQTLINALVAQTCILIFLDLIVMEVGREGLLEHVARFPFALAGGIAVGIVAGWLLPIGALLGDADRRMIGWRRQAVALGGVMVAGLGVYFGTSHFQLESVFATLAVGVTLCVRDGGWEPILRRDWRRVWAVAEVLLFVSLGSRVDVRQLAQGELVLLCFVIVWIALAARLVVCRLILTRTSLDRAQRRHLAISHIPKATVQAVFGALPLHVFLTAGREDLVDPGSLLLLLSVVAIVATMPVGAAALERSGEKLAGRS